MKKIVGILAAAALIATSVFAADVSAQVRIAGEIFAYDGTTVDAKEGKPAGSFSMLKAVTQARPYWTPYITLSTSTDEAGAEIKFIEEDDGKQNIKMDRSNVWFKPLDMLTIKAGFQGYNMNQETIDWTSTNIAEDWGYAVSYAQDAIAVNVFAITGNGGWFYQDAIGKYGTSDDPATSYLKDLYINGSYEADFGKISAMFEYKGKGGEFVKAKEGEYGWIKNTTNPATSPTWGLTGAESAYMKSFNPQTIKFGAGYKNTIDALTFWADVVGTSRSALSDKEKTLVGAGITKWLADDANKGKSYADAYKAFGYYLDKNSKSVSTFGLTVDGFVQYAQDALEAKGYVKFDVNRFDNINEKGDSDLMAFNNVSLGLKAYVGYKLDNGIKLFGQFGNDNLLRKECVGENKSNLKWADYSSVFVSTIQAGAEGSVGILSYKAWLEFHTGENITKATEAKKNFQYDAVKVSMPVWLTVAF